MDAVILAAGLGTRLRPYTLETPKPLLLVRGRPILDWTLAALPPGVDRVIVVVHHLAAQIDAYLRAQSHVSQWLTVTQKEPRGTGDALRNCQHLLQSDHFLVINGDDLFGAADLAALAHWDAGILVAPVDEPERFGIVYRKADGTLEKLVEKPDLKGTWPANTGAYSFPREVFQIELQLSARGEYEITDYITALAQRRPVHVVEARFWLPIGNVAVWRTAEDMDLEAAIKPVRITRRPQMD
jgi:UDP-N-acetylglucosamine diphosphorylase / glucose-1-phosphate thymidylyltransferase / UDP-N-acetylgalactosamine diphosphorylase / glucosamine-1-phosphate N-acetyltransferase / galactosamine-1-phosphate N-acetyltransferase